MTTTFADLGLRPELAQSVSELGFEIPTPIQARVIPVMLERRDVLGQAQTGTGKTAAFGLPLLQLLEPGAGVQALVLAPTRELASQVAQALEAYSGSLGIRVLTIYGGQSYAYQIGSLRRGVDVVVGTPGRVLDLLGQGKLSLEALSLLVLDEADEMLGMGFIEDIEAIMAQAPEVRQTALFSATLPAEIRRLAERSMKAPEKIAIEPGQRTVEAIDQRYYLVNDKDRTAALTRLFEAEDITSALVFAQTRVRTGELANELSSRGYPAEVLNGDLAQEAREQVLARFQEGKLKVLVATDIAARGLDIDHLSHVFNYELSRQPESYVHRIGRTGRAGRTGVAITLVTPREMWLLRRVEAFTRQPLTRTELPTVEEIETRRQGRLLEQMKTWLERGRCRREMKMVEELVEAGYSELEVAACALKLARAEEKQRPLTPIGAVEMPAPRARTRDGGEKGMVRLHLDAGRADGLRPSEIVATIARHAQIPGGTIGAIRINDRHTLLDVPERYVAKVLSRAGGYRMCHRRVRLSMARA